MTTEQRFKLQAQNTEGIKDWYIESDSYGWVIDIMTKEGYTIGDDGGRNWRIHKDKDTDAQTWREGIRWINTIKKATL